MSNRKPHGRGMEEVRHSVTPLVNSRLEEIVERYRPWELLFLLLFIYLFIYYSYSLEPVGYARYRKEISINKSSKTDIRKQARKPNKGNPPLGRRLPQSIRIQLYKN